MDTKNRKIAIITGATGCLGSSVALKLVNEGYYVIGVGKKEDSRVTNLINKIGKNNCEFHFFDVASKSDVASFFRKKVLGKGNLKLVVLCAGILKMSAVDRVTFLDWKRTIDTNISGIFYFLQESIKIMKKEREGLIILIGSRWGISGAKMAAAYSASKSALRALTKSMQLEYSGTKIRCILVSPGSILSKMSDSVKSNIKNDLIKANDIANLIFYISETPNYVIFDEIVIKAFPYDLYN